MPERWLVNYEGPNSISKVKFSAKQGVSNPFGLGYRACYGQKLAVRLLFCKMLRCDGVSNGVILIGAGTEDLHCHIEFGILFR